MVLKITETNYLWNRVCMGMPSFSPLSSLVSDCWLNDETINSKITRGLETRLRILNSNEYKRQQLIKHQHFTADIVIKSWLKVLNKQCFFYLTMISVLPDAKISKWSHLIVMSGGSDMVSNSWSVIIFCRLSEEIKPNAHSKFCGRVGWGWWAKLY